MVGFTEDAFANRDIQVSSFYLNTNSLAIPPTPTIGITALTAGQIVGSGNDTPTVMGVTNATTFGIPWVRFGLDDPAGGGIDVDPTARVNVVGATNSTNYPVLATVLPAFVTPRSRQPLPDPQDSVRTALDMLPTTGPFGCGRTDGTGTPTATANTFPSSFPGFSGGTTPLCALRPFGNQVGWVTSASSISRMMIDIEGSLTTGSTPAIVVSRPTATSQLDLLGLQFLLPGSTPPLQLLDGEEIWTTNSPTVFLIWGTSPASNVPPAPLRFQLSTLPPGRPAVSAQLFCGSLTGPITAGIFPACTTTTFSGLSPAIWF